MMENRYCERCKEQVPVREFTLINNGEAWRHTGLLRGVFSELEPGDDGECGFVEIIK